MDILDQWLARAGTLLGLGAIFYAWLTTRSTKNSERLDKVEGLQAKQTLLLERLTIELNHRPDKDSVQDLKLEITRLTGTVEVLATKVGSVDRTVEVMDRYLRKDET